MSSNIKLQEIHNRDFIVELLRVKLDEAVEFIEFCACNAQYPKYYINEITKRTEKFVLEVNVEKTAKVCVSNENTKKLVYVHG